MKNDLVKIRENYQEKFCKQFWKKKIAKCYFLKTAKEYLKENLQRIFGPYHHIRKEIVKIIRKEICKNPQKIIQQNSAKTTRNKIFETILQENLRKNVRKKIRKIYS